MLGKFKPASLPGIMASFFPSLPPLQYIITGSGQRESNYTMPARSMRALAARCCVSIQLRRDIFHSKFQPTTYPAGGPMGVVGRPTPVEHVVARCVAAGPQPIGRANGEEPDRRGPARNKKLAGGLDWVRAQVRDRINGRERNEIHCMQVIVRSSLVPPPHTHRQSLPPEILLSPKVDASYRNGAT